MRKWHHEPLLHFLLAGALIFGAHAWLGRSRGEVAPSAIEVNEGTVQRLREQWELQWKHAPSEQELRGLVQDHIREEVLYREGIALGLDRDDTIIRRRLAQKMEFLTQDIAALASPDEAALAKYYEENVARYMEPARLTFSQLYFSREKRGVDAETAARAALVALTRGPDPVEEMGDATLLPGELRGASTIEVDAQFGRAFAAALGKLPLGEWQGPVPSSYGFHLVRVTEQVKGREIGLAAAREAVLRDFHEARRQETNRDLLERLKGRYRITIDEDAIKRASVDDMAEASR
jgi:peptidyl-prolyl cis-trans isomerase C